MNCTKCHKRIPQNTLRTRYPNGELKVPGEFLKVEVLGTCPLCGLQHHKTYYCSKYWADHYSKVQKDTFIQAPIQSSCGCCGELVLDQSLKLIAPEKPGGFALWTCPQCRTSHTEIVTEGGKRCRRLKMRPS